MTHPRVEQLRFTRAEWLRGLEGISDEDASRRFGPMNCISWTVGHLAWHEQRSWLQFAQGQLPFPELNKIFAYGAPASQALLSEMLVTWKTVTELADPYLGSLTTAGLQADLLRNGKSVGQTVGSAMQRVTFHYWYHIGEIQAIRQMLGHPNLPEYVGDIEIQAPYRAE